MDSKMFCCIIEIFTYSFTVHVIAVSQTAGSHALCIYYTLYIIPTIVANKIHSLTKSFFTKWYFFKSLTHSDQWSATKVYKWKTNAEGLWDSVWRVIFFFFMLIQLIHFLVDLVLIILSTYSKSLTVIFH